MARSSFDGRFHECREFRFASVGGTHSFDHQGNNPDATESNVTAGDHRYRECRFELTVDTNGFTSTRQQSRRVRDRDPRGALDVYKRGDGASSF